MLRKTLSLAQTIPRWLRWTLAVCALITAIGGACAVLEQAAAKVEPYAPATRGALRAQRDWSDAEHQAIRGEMQTQRQEELELKRALVCVVAPARAARLGVDCGP